MNGFNVNISPAPYQTNSNSQEDDAVSSYTYTLDEKLLLNEFVVGQLLIKPNPTTGLFKIELDSLYGEFILEIISVNGIVIIQRTVDIHPQSPTVTVQGKNLDNGFYTVRLHNQNRVYYGKLMIVNE